MTVKDERPQEHVLATKRLAVETIVYSVSRVVPAVLNLLLALRLAWSLSPNDFGRYSIITSTAVMISMFAYRWLAETVVRFGADDLGRSSLITVGSVLWAGTTAIIIVGTFLVGTVRRDSGIWAVSALGVSMGWELFWIEYLRADGSSVAYTALSILTSACKYTWLFIVLMFTRADLIIIVYGFAGSSVLTGLIALVLISTRVGWSGFRWSTELMGQIITYGLPLIGTKASNYLLAVADRYIIAWFRDPAEVGIYSSLYQLGENSIKMIGLAMVMSSAPLMFKAWSKGENEKAKRLFESSLSLFGAVSFPVLAILLGFSNEIVQIILPATYYAGRVILPWIGVGGFFLVLSLLGNRIWELQRETGKLFWYSAIPVAVNIGLNFLAIPYFGYRAAALSTVATYAVHSLILFTASKRYFPWSWPWQSLLKSSINSGIGLVLGRLVVSLAHMSLPSTLISGLAVFGLTYTGLSLVGKTQIISDLGFARIGRNKE